MWYAAEIEDVRGQVGAAAVWRRTGARPREPAAPIGLCAGRQECGQRVRHAEHRIVAGVELVP
jgi:hypothetical protein